MNSPCRRRAIYAMRAEAERAQAQPEKEVIRNEEVQEEAEAAPVLKACPRCGKQMRRVSYLHTKHCKG